MACMVSKELFLPPSCLLQRVGATDFQSIICSKPELFQYKTVQSLLSNLFFGGSLIRGEGKEKENR